MSVRVLFIVAGLKERMKLDTKILLRREEKQKFKTLLAELRLWIEKSNEVISVSIITPYEEIYEIGVQNHFESVKNEFAKVSEGSMIRFGLQKYQNEESYMIISTSDTKLFRADMFDALYEVYKKNTEKIIFSKYKEKLRLPLVFSGKKADLLNSLLYQEKGKFIFKATSKDSSFCVMDELFTQNEKTVTENQNETKEERTEEKWLNKVVIVRGAGRIASVAAICLNKFGYKVIMTEKENPDTLFRKNTFSRAVLKSRKRMKNVRVYLAAMTPENILTAFESNIIPLIIDPDLKCLEMFKEGYKSTEIFGNSSKNSFDPLAKFKNEKSHEPDNSSENIIKESNDKMLSDYKLVGVCDFSSYNENRKLKQSDAPITLGTLANHKYENGPILLLDTEYGLSYGKVTSNIVCKINHVDKKQNEILCIENNELFNNIYPPQNGKVRFIKRIGDLVEVNDILAQIVLDNDNKIDVKSDYKGFLVASANQDTNCLNDQQIAIISSMISNKEDCFNPFPLDMALGMNVVLAFESYKEEE